MSRFPTIFALVVALTSCAGAEPDRTGAAGAVVERARVSMGSELRLTAWTSDETAAVAAFEAVFAEFDRLDSLMSVWRQGSDIERLNAAAGQGRVTVSQEVLDVLRVARDVSDWTGGTFDVTFAALSDVWKFDHDQDRRVPSRKEIGARVGLVDYRALEFDVASRTAYLERKGMRVHLGGIGKGYAVDRATNILRSKGLRDFMIQSGGDMYVAGRRGERPWRVGIRDPRGPADQSFAAIDLTDTAFSTSGDYERFFVKDGRRYHHILDPRTGEPASGCRSVTIVAERSILADALSTGVFLLGPDAGIALIEKLPSVEGVIVSSGNKVLVSSGLKGHLALLTQPTDAP